jgi:predicted nucleotidyltransferase
MIIQYLDKIKLCVLRYLAEENVAVAFFGSAAVGGDTYASDVDIAVIPKGKWNQWKLSLLREELDDLNVPYTVDIVDFTTSSETFRKTALARAIWWKG